MEKIIVQGVVDKVYIAEKRGVCLIFTAWT